MRMLQLSLMVFCLYQKEFHSTYSMMVIYINFVSYCKDLLIYIRHPLFIVLLQVLLLSIYAYVNRHYHNSNLI